MSPCQYVQLPDGEYAIVCSRGRRPKRCAVCGRMTADLLCDGPGETPGATCDAPLCRRCATHVAPDRDYCPAHAQGVQ